MFDQYSSEESPLHSLQATTGQSPPTTATLQIITISAGVEGCLELDGSSSDRTQENAELNPQDAWLPITESRNGNFFTCVFHLLSSGLGFQALLLPLAFSILGWTGGIICLLLASTWQLYTTWVLVHLHEALPGPRCSRFLQLSVASFGPKLGKLLAIFPVMYLSGGTCVILIITGGRTMELFYDTVCGSGASCDAKSLSGTEWLLVFTCVAIIMAQRPNLNSIASVSFIAAITAVGYYSLIWVSTIPKDRLDNMSRDPLQNEKSHMTRVSSIFNAFGIIALSFRGHNLVLEIQGILPSSSKHPSRKTMWRGVLISYLIITICILPLAISGFWAYGNKIPSKIGNISEILQFYTRNASKSIKGLTYMLVLINCLTSFQLFAMVVFDNFELRYISIKNKQCSFWVRTGLRLLFGGLAFLIAVSFPFLPSLASLIGGIALPLTFAYPCFMWISIKKPLKNSFMWCFNFGLGGLGLVLSVLVVAAAVWNLSTKGLHANFFKP
ncbi:lysine histidine transporter-like 8 [Manihot esculenta]|uniref:Amino acid transporter transmembrane domain-containing protein n=1 Tax=Manihot esculenta TaxID=3983 RepID=A0A2C9V042_MANES|nr:lysine histidine transporter-like 8 [Manihot esculenta]